ncbi:hypothetical protein [Sphingomonas sp. BK069]|uniref:hypothetical protein n=1 Tax=Sphingomonas sp. BK069 TaxID=2586979 RepID=UPI00161AFE01|nr:hypothetical protein [Sphingomonas sp. BK069]MBB3348810.1 hypothetical protein [Sphingomonas sp. BK069]
MQSDPRPGRRLLSLLPLTALARGLFACGPRIAISRAALPCSDLVQEPLAADVAPADLPQIRRRWPTGRSSATLKPVASRRRTPYRRAALDAIRRCEARDRAVDQQLKAR